MEVRALQLVGVLTWLIIGIPNLLWEIEHHALLTPRGITWLLCFCAFIVFFLLRTGTTCARWLGIVYTATQTILALICIAFSGTGGAQPVLLVIVSGQLGGLTLPVGLMWLFAQTAVLYAIGGGALAALAYFSFQLFGLFTIRIAHKEADARQALAEANAELQVATGLLEISSRTEERLRIARDLHDLLGHHLTALSLNLEVASHLCDGAALEQIEKTKALTKVLLGDVRDVVSRLRENEPVDLAAALHALQKVIERPAVNLDIGSEVTVTDPAVAQVALRAIQEIVTNAVRHSGARNLWLKLATTDHTLAIAARDDGAGTDHVSFGHGLRGMRERVEQLRGTMEVTSMRGHGFEVNVRIPLQGPAA